MTGELTFRWLGVQGIELRCAGKTLLIDPFFTRPCLGDMLSLRRVTPNRALSTRLAPACDAILVTHPHHDHILDVPDLALHSGAPVYGSANSGQILALSGVPAGQFHRIHPGDLLECGPFVVEVLAGRHIALPVDFLLNGPLSPNLRPPFRLVDYRMDEVFGFFITAAGTRILFCPGEELQLADILFSSTVWEAERYRRLLAEVRPRLFVPLHWDNFFRPLDQPLVELPQPGRMSLKRLARLAAETAPGAQFMVPELFRRLVLTLS